MEVKLMEKVKRENIIQYEKIKVINYVIMVMFFIIQLNII